MEIASLAPHVALSAFPASSAKQVKQMLDRHYDKNEHQQS